MACDIMTNAPEYVGLDDLGQEVWVCTELCGSLHGKFMQVDVACGLLQHRINACMLNLCLCQDFHMPKNIIISR